MDVVVRGGGVQSPGISRSLPRSIPRPDRLGVTPTTGISRSPPRSIPHRANLKISAALNPPRRTQSVVRKLSRKRIQLVLKLSQQVVLVGDVDLTTRRQ